MCGITDAKINELRIELFINYETSIISFQKTNDDSSEDECFDRESNYALRNSLNMNVFLDKVEKINQRLSVFSKEELISIICQFWVNGSEGLVFVNK